MAETRKGLGDRLDNLIGVFSPERAARRLAFRNAMRIGASHYRGSRQTRISYNWIVGQESADASMDGELQTLRNRSRDLNRNNPVAAGITHNKVPGQYKRLYLLDEDVDLVRSLPRGLPKAFFFRHEARRGLPTAKQGRFGKDYMYTWWRRACENLGIKGVDLYGGTRHSTVTALGERFTPEEIMGDGSGHTTNKAFARYYQIRADQRRAISAHARPAHHLHIDLVQGKKGKKLK